jgi:hypothetical protein
MNKNTGRIIQSSVFILSLFASVVCNAHGRCPNASWSGIYGDVVGLGGCGPDVVIGAPLINCVPVCRTVPVCNRKGYCWLEESCY